MINAMLSTLKLTDVGSYSPWWCSAYGVIKWCVFKSYILPTVFFRFLSSLNYNYYSKLWLLLCICRSYLIGKTMQCPRCWVWPSARRFLNNVTAKIGLSPQTEVTKKKKKNTSSTAIPFFFWLLLLSFSSRTLFSLSLFFSRRIFGLILPSAFGLFSQSKDCNFRSVRSQKSSKIMLWLLRLPIH